MSRLADTRLPYLYLPRGSDSHSRKGQKRSKECSQRVPRDERGTAERGKRRGREDGNFIGDLLATGNRLGLGNDRGITNGPQGRAKKGGTGCQRNNADAKANKMPSGVAPINHVVYVPPFSVFVVTPARGIVASAIDAYDK